MPNAGVKQQIAAITAAMPPPVSSLRSSIACVLDDTRHAAINDHANVCNRYGLNKNRHHINVNAAMRRDARLMIGALAAATGRHVDTIGYYKNSASFRRPQPLLHGGAAHADGHRPSVRARRADLRRMARTLAGLAAQCDAGLVPHCPLIEAIQGPK